MNTIIQDIKYQFNKGNAVTRLIFINVAAYIGIHLIFVFFYLLGGTDDVYYGFVREWFHLPSSPLKLLTRPWTLFTYMFLHSPEGILHILFNMLVLWWFGRITNDLISNDKIVPLYLLGGLVGGLLYMISYNLFPPFMMVRASSTLVGASASVMAVVLAAATLNPRGIIRIFLIGNAQLQYVALVLVLIDILSIPSFNPGGHLAHIGGAFMGWLFIHQLRQGRDLSRPFINFGHWFNNLLQGQPSQPRKKREPRMVYKKAHQTSGEGRRSGSSNYNGYSRSFNQKYRNMSKEECLDAILDKIKDSGYNSLSEDEKEFLDRSSKG